MSPRLLLSFLSLSSMIVAGCSAETSAPEGDVDSTEDAVRTAKCPASISVDVSSLRMRTFFSELHAPSDYDAMKAASADLGGRRTLHVEGAITSKKSGRCTYANGAAVLYTKGGKDIVRLSTKAAGRDVFVYTYPKSFSPEITFAKSSNARIVAALAPNLDPADDVDASEAPAPNWVSLGSGRALKGMPSDGLVLANGADETRDDGPDTLRVIAPAPGATATIHDESLATCEAKVNAALSNASRTVFDLSLEYEVDDGFNGCTFDFKAPGYHASLTAGLSVDD